MNKENVTSYSSDGNEVRVTFLVSVPPDTPPGDIFITGNHKKLGRWTPNAVPLKNVAPHQYQISFIFKVNTHLHFKFTRGEWKNVEKDKDFYERPDRTLWIKKGGIFHFAVDNWNDMGNPEDVRPHTWVGNIREHSHFFARKLNNYRNIWVYLPPSYDEDKKKRYPVLYAHDGNNVFDRSTSFLGIEWELDDTAERLMRNGRMREVIIVAIANTPQRQSEYTHIYMAQLGGGKADHYADFIINDLKPFIDNTYRTLRDRQYTAVMGSSLGGLVSLYLAWKYHHVFSMAGVVSPSVWWAFRDILHVVRTTKHKPPIKIWLDIGTLEGRTIDEKEKITYAVRDVRDLRDVLIAKGFRLHYDLEYLEVEGGEHNEAAWAKRVDKILLFFFGAKQSIWRKLLRLS